MKPVKVNLKSIEQRLNSDPEYLKRFLSDPVGHLRSEGLEITDSMEKQLNDFVGNLSGSQTGVAGSNLGGNAQELGIGISIGKSF